MNNACKRALSIKGFKIICAFIILGGSSIDAEAFETEFEKQTKTYSLATQILLKRFNRVVLEELLNDENVQEMLKEEVLAFSEDSEWLDDTEIHSVDLETLIFSTEIEKKNQSALKHQRSARSVGLDARLAILQGAGIAGNYTPVSAVTIEGSFFHNYFSYTFSADVVINIIPIFVDTRWTPVVSVGIQHLRFNDRLDTIFADALEALADEGIDLAFDGMGLNFVSLLGGIDYMGRRGFRFQLRGGRLEQIGPSMGYNSEDGIELRNWGIYTGFIGFGYQFY
jgi:hypothetical protein